MIGSGVAASSAISHLISQRTIESFIRGVISFPSDGPGTPVIGQKVPWYMDNSRVFVTSSEQFGTTIPFSRAYGTCVSNGILDFLDMHSSPVYSTPFSMCLAIEDVFNFIHQRLASNSKNKI